MASQVKASHILVPKQGQAVELIKRINGGEKFEDLAKAHSTCPSGKRGGDLGWFRRGQMVKPFENAAFNLSPGQMTQQPVKTDFGYHIIKTVEAK